MNRDRQELIETVMQSPAAVKVKDRTAWLSIFARYNVVEDPVGSRPHLSGVMDAKTGKRGHGPLERFFDTFIAPNQITFHVDKDIVCDNHVVRDLSIEIAMSDKVTAHVPMHVIYELCEEDGDLKISRLGAYWELWPMIKQLMSKGMACVSVVNALGWRMMSIQGLSGAIGFMQGFRGIGDQGKQSVMEFANALNNKSLSDMMGLFAGSNQGVYVPYGGDHFTPDVLVDELEATLEVSKLLSSGYVVSCNVEVSLAHVSHQGVAFFEFNAKNKKIDQVTFYWNE